MVVVVVVGLPVVDSGVEPAGRSSTVVEGSIVVVEAAGPSDRNAGALAPQAAPPRATATATASAAGSSHRE
jgi:hypothetical protein